MKNGLRQAQAPLKIYHTILPNQYLHWLNYFLPALKYADSLHRNYLRAAIPQNQKSNFLQR